MPARRFPRSASTARQSARTNRSRRPAWSAFWRRSSTASEDGSTSWPPLGRLASYAPSALRPVVLELVVERSRAASDRSRPFAVLPDWSHERADCAVRSPANTWSRRWAAKAWCPLGPKFEYPNMPPTVGPPGLSLLAHQSFVLLSALAEQSIIDVLSGV